MAEQAEALHISYYHSTESAWAETPSTPTMTQLPFTGGFGRPVKGTVRSNILDGRGMQGDLIEVAKHMEDGFPFELVFTDFQNMFLGGLRTTYTTIAISGATDVSADTSDDSFNATSTDLSVIKANTWFKVAGFVDSANNGIFRASADAVATKVLVNAKMTTAGIITLTPNLVTEAAGPSVNIDAKFGRNGIVKNSFLFETRVLGTTVTEYFSTRGVRVNTIEMTIAPEQIVTGNITVVGERVRPSATSEAGSSNAWSGDTPLAGGVNSGSWLEGGALMSANLPRQLTLTINANARIDRAVSRATGNADLPIEIGYGRFSVNGTLETYMETDALITKMIDHTATSLTIPMADADGNVMVLSFPAVKYSEAAINVQDPDSPLAVPLSWEAEPNNATATGYMAQIDWIAA